MIFPIFFVVLISVSCIRASAETSFSKCQEKCSNIFGGNINNHMMVNKKEQEYCVNVCVIKMENMDLFRKLCDSAKICKARAGCRAACHQRYKSLNNSKKLRSYSIKKQDRPISFNSLTKKNKRRKERMMKHFSIQTNSARISRNTV